MSPAANSGAETRGHLSIREVLQLLLADFPDVTISKIRFLEARGLIHPERSPSGYRKFDERDVERLRWILRQQREHYLPLNVIKVRLDGAAEQPNETPSLFDDHRATRAAQSVREAIQEPERDTQPLLRGGASAEVLDDHDAIEQDPVEEPESLEIEVENVPSGKLTAAELAAGARVELSFVTECEEFGLFAANQLNGTRYYGEEAVAICRLAGRFRPFGIEPRHLKAFRHASAREAELFAQAVAPLLHQRNPQAKERAMGDLAQLTKLAAALRGVFVQAELDGLVEH